ncbi:hypothetical protein ElyMa_004338500 [Elysia marginata]|uniref:Uncharacterized protein n=1 Tax=Elysia marginata TaxID=1093978 RepID=A0AAV4H3E0_9GAST|nr:hypothetical protein ElyMa_004338500 [Elysia marginata]
MPGDSGAHYNVKQCHCLYLDSHFTEEETNKKPGVYDKNDHLLNTTTGLCDKRYLDPNAQAFHDWILRSTMLESQRTGGSLKIDEDYVPMRVSVRKLTTMDLAKDGTSLYQEFSGFFTSSSSAGDILILDSKHNNTRHSPG